MAISGAISSAELEAQVRNRFVDQFFEVMLINNPGSTYIPGEPGIDEEFTAAEVATGTGGYQRQVISYSSTDVTSYTDDGIALNNKAAVFTHDGTAESIDFTHVALVWGGGQPLGFDVATSYPTPGQGNTGGPYTNLPVSGGSGQGMVVDLTITNSGATAADYTLTIVSRGYGYLDSDTLTITEATLVASGATASAAGDLVFSPSSVYSPSNAGQVVSVAKTTNSVVLSGGNQAGFYFNLKNFGYYSF